MNDKNSSLLREYIVVSIAGYKPTETKIGYNGFKQSSEIGGEIPCEAKPQNINTEENKLRKSKRKLNGGGNFTDYTHKRFLKDKKSNLNMVIGGFVNGELIYILEFPFSHKDFVGHLKNQIEKRFPNGDKLGEFLRSANFTFEHYKNSKKLKPVFIKSESLDKYKDSFTKNFYDFLKKINEKNKK